MKAPRLHSVAAWTRDEMPPHEHDPGMLVALTYGAVPNLLLWTGCEHQLALSLKWDYVPLSIRREAEKRSP